MRGSVKQGTSSPFKVLLRQIADGAPLLPAEIMNSPAHILAHAAQAQQLWRVRTGWWLCGHRIIGGEYTFLLTILFRRPRGSSTMVQRYMTELKSFLADSAYCGEYKVVNSPPPQCTSKKRADHFHKWNHLLKTLLPANIGRLFVREAHAPSETGKRHYDGVIVQLAMRQHDPVAASTDTLNSCSETEFLQPDWLCRERGLFECEQFGIQLEDEHDADSDDEDGEPD